MHGLINKAIQSFITDSFGEAVWQGVSTQSGLAEELGPDGFEAMQHYDDHVTETVVTVAANLLDRPRDSLLEDLGTYLVSNPRLAALRRLLRFGGVSFTDFLYSLEDLPGRTLLAVPELALPEIVTEEKGEGRFLLICHACPPGFGHVMLGILRALADDYGALAVLEHIGARPETEGVTQRQRQPGLTRTTRQVATGNSDRDACSSPDRRHEDLQDEYIMIEVHDPAFHSGRQFQLVGAENP